MCQCTNILWLFFFIFHLFGADLNEVTFEIASTKQRIPPPKKNCECSIGVICVGRQNGGKWKRLSSLRPHRRAEFQWNGSRAQQAQRARCGVHPLVTVKGGLGKKKKAWHHRGGWDMINVQVVRSSCVKNEILKKRKIIVNCGTKWMCSRTVASLKLLNCNGQIRCSKAEVLFLLCLPSPLEVSSILSEDGLLLSI